MQNSVGNIDSSGICWTDKTPSFPTRTVRLATCFSGIGAIEHAFHRLGIKNEIIFAGDINSKCKETYFANYDITDDRWHNDIHDFDASKYIGGVDLLVGGAPCQAFSMVGDRRGFEDTRGTLFREYARVIKECQPKIFIFENVQGLLTHNKGCTWDVIRRTFEDYCGYDIHFQLLNSKNYGIPQHRERLFCIGFHEATDFLYPRPIKLNYRMYDFLEDWIDTIYYDSTTKRKTIYKGYPDREMIFGVQDVDDKYYLSTKTAKYVLAGGTKNFKTSTETDLNIARPLLQSMHKMHRAGVDNYVTYRKDKGVGGIRKLTPRECHRLMGFRDDFKIVVSDTNAYQQAGNSIVVDVLIALLKQLDITQYGVE